MSFIKKFIELYSSSASEDFVEKLTNRLKTTYYKKNESIVKLGDISSKFYILKEGIVRSYIIGPKGKEHIKILHKAINIFAPLTDLIKKQPSTLIFDCLTDCEILEADFYELFTSKILNLEISSFYIKILEGIYTSSENKIHDLSILNATERYIKLRGEIPNIENLIQQYHIASYLNITPTQLSRIRKDYYSK
tara:strand:- start:1305 stop:1883 length:579 start_codon:yes stop_codon:yes gene_type:complete